MPASENTSEVRQVMAEQVIGRRGKMYEKMKKKVVTRRIIHLPHAGTRSGIDARGLVCRGAVYVPRPRSSPRKAQ